MSSPWALASSAQSSRAQCSYRVRYFPILIVYDQLISFIVGLIWISKHSIFEGTQVGNVIMWMTVFFGQPMVEVMYCYEYNRVNTFPSQ